MNILGLLRDVFERTGRLAARAFVVVAAALCVATGFHDVIFLAVGAVPFTVETSIRAVTGVALICLGVAFVLAVRRSLEMYKDE